jgi:hypothetical protein
MPSSKFAFRDIIDFTENWKDSDFTPELAYSFQLTTTVRKFTLATSSASNKNVWVAAFKYIL